MFGFKTYYENFSLDNPTVSLTVIIWAICAGLAVGVILYTLSKSRAHKLIRALHLGGHSTAENAASLEQLGIKAAPLLRRALREGQPLRKYVSIANGEECLSEKKSSAFGRWAHRTFLGENIPKRIDFSSALFFLPEETRHTAEIRYESKGSSLAAAVISAVIFILIAVGLTYCMPLLLDLVDSMITAYKNL